MVREVILRPDAEADIEDAADYTIDQWGHQQARAYVSELRQAIEQLATTALRYPHCDTIHPGLRRKRSGMHHIYYLANHECVEVLSVLHVQRDPGLHLKVETRAVERDEEIVVGQIAPVLSQTRMR